MQQHPGTLLADHLKNDNKMLEVANMKDGQINVRMAKMSYAIL